MRESRLELGFFGGRGFLRGGMQNAGAVRRAQFPLLIFS
jgi:hypothetical protein